MENTGKNISIEELNKYLEEEISYFKELKSKNGMSDEGKTRLETFEHILKKING